MNIKIWANFLLFTYVIYKRCLKINYLHISIYLRIYKNHKIFRNSYSVVERISRIYISVLWSVVCF